MNTIILSAAVITAAVLLLSALRSEWERRQLKTEYYSVSRVKNDGERIRLLFISDVHDYFDSEVRTEAVIQAVRKAGPELVLLGGDIVSVIKEKKTPPDTEAACKAVSRIAAEHYVIYAEGNHEIRFRERYPEEYRAYRSRLEAAGVVFLIDQRVDYKDIVIHGVSLDMRYFDKRIPFIGTDAEMPEKYLISKLRLPDKSRFNVLLMHSPMYLKAAEAWGAELVLSGHFHGGTIRLPDGRGLMSPQYHFFNSQCSGVHTDGSSVMIVNRGLGTHTFNIRLNDLPEISVVDIMPQRNG